MKQSNLEVLTDSDTLKIFKTTCQCSSDEHMIDVIVEKLSENSFPMTTLVFKSGIYPKTFLEKLKVIFSILFKGYYTTEDEFIFRDETHVMYFSSALYQAIKEVKQVKS